MSSMSPAQLPRELVEADNLPTPPGVALEVMRLADDPHIEAEDIGRLIRTDPALTVRMLRAVNSAAYGLPQTIDSVPRACALLGLERPRPWPWGSPSSTRCRWSMPRRVSTSTSTGCAAR